jgi:NaMN:DMB phosphoribosyltransferase
MRDGKVVASPTLVSEAAPKDLDSLRVRYRTSAENPHPDIAEGDSLIWQPAQVVVGTTRWVAEDPTGDTVGLAQDIGSVPLLATGLSFATSRYPQLQAYEQGYVKEGVGAGGCAIATHLYKDWNQVQLLQSIEALVERYCRS